MGLCVVFVSGARRSGKSSVIQTMAKRLCKRPPHYLRLVKAGSGKSMPRQKKPKPDEECGIASARWIEFTDDRIFEVLPDALSAIHRQDRYGSVAIEADSDPSLRYAYPYDHRIFVMPRPASFVEVFRDPRQAAKELRSVLDDTAAFASEIFGLFHGEAEEPADPHEDRPDLSGTHMRSFLYSPLGDELVTRIQLQPPYHGLVESDVVVVNPTLGPDTPESAQCLGRIEQLLARVRKLTDRRGELIVCDPADENDRGFPRMLESLKPMCLGGT